MIETRTALANLDAIAATPGIDVLFLGPSDLSIALTDGKHARSALEAVEAALDRIVAAAQKAGKIAGALLRQRRARGGLRQARHALLAVGSDLASCAPARARSSRG